MEIFFTRDTVTLEHNVTQCVSLHQCVWDGGMKKSIIIDRVVVKDKPSFDCVLGLNMRGRSLLVAGLYHKKIEANRYEVQDGKRESKLVTELVSCFVHGLETQMLGSMIYRETKILIPAKAVTL